MSPHEPCDLLTTIVTMLASRPTTISSGMTESVPGSSSLRMTTFIREIPSWGSGSCLDVPDDTTSDAGNDPDPLLLADVLGRFEEALGAVPAGTPRLELPVRPPFQEFLELLLGFLCGASGTSSLMS
mmetsp:Transcript_53696/g.142616  ORF Transcript_53696/g.142616 Transcript_53696/m.142616 type:complete len:127 (+) Transcript_53696:36-416(+)